ncbi:MAG: membrane protein insertion efficiency factor YidD [Pseudomonadota bacterium]
MKPAAVTILAVLVLVAGSLAAPARAGSLQAGSLAGSLNDPWDFARHPEAPEVSSPARGIFTALLHGWQRVVAPVDGTRCPSRPSCSHYAAEAVKTHGPLLGAFMAADRLIHEASEADHAPLVTTPEGYKIDDPLSANDFWLRRQ